MNCFGAFNGRSQGQQASTLNCGGGIRRKIPLCYYPDTRYAIMSNLVKNPIKTYRKNLPKKNHLESHYQRRSYSSIKQTNQSHISLKIVFT